MDNQTVYRKTLTFSLHQLLWDCITLLLLGGLGIAGFFIADRTFDKGLIGLAVGLVIGLVLVIIVVRYNSFRFKAAQIGMMTRAVTEGDLPDDVMGEGKALVSSRFSTVAGYFAATSIIKGIFNEIGRGITKLGESIGGENGNAVGSAISLVIQTIVSYLCDCCLGWVFYRSQITAPKATLEGAVIFFKHGRTFAKNMARVFVFAAVSLILIGGLFGGIAFVIFSRFPAWFDTLATEVGEAVARSGKEVPEWVSDPKMLMIISAALVGVIIWRLLHSTFVRPYVLVGVLRNYMASGVNDIPGETELAMLDGKSTKFRKLHTETV